MRGMKLIDLYKNGTIKYLVDTGFISINKAVQFRYYEEFQEALKTCSSKTEAVWVTADVCGVSNRTIWRAINNVETMTKT